MSIPEPMDETTPDLSEVEAALRAIAGVKAARLVTDETGKPIEVHIVAGSEKSPKQLVRDIQTVSLASFGLDLDRRIVSVVQFPEESVAAPEGPARPTIQEVATEVRGSSATVVVKLAYDQKSSSGTGSGPNTKDGLLRSSATATLQAVKALVDEGTWIELEHVGMQRSGIQDVVIATVTTGAGRGGSLSGSAVVTSLPGEAAVRAVLDALNRRLWRA